MAQNASKNKHANDNSQAQIMPTDRLDFLAAIAMDHGINARNSLAVRAATVILKHRYNETGKIVLKHKTIAAEMGCSVSAVRDAVNVLKKRWFKVEPVYIDRECVANRYDPCWDEAAAVGGVWSLEDRRMVSGGQTSGLGGIDPCPHEGMQNSESHTQSPEPDVLNPDSLHTHSGERVQTGSGSGEGCPSGTPADDLDRIDFSECIRQLEEGLPPFEPFGDFKEVDQDNSRRGAIYQMKKLCRLGWSLDEIRKYLDAYCRDFDEQAQTNFKRNGQCGRTLASLLSQLVNQCSPKTRDTEDGEIYGWNIPVRFLQREADKPASNDNELNEIHIAV
jgi:hypothetical protein